MLNRALAIDVIEELLRHGVEEFILCPGARNAPFINLISNSSLSYSTWPEERSAAFFALGRARKKRAPIAVITTSGTAAGELLPALMEGYYAKVPLIAITADRPRRYRGSNAPQTADQVGLYGIYAPTTDLEGPEKLSLNYWDRSTPLHINVCFEEPARSEIPHEFVIEKKPQLKKQEGSDQLLQEFIKRVKRPLVIVSTLKNEAREQTVDFLLRLNAPVYLEAVSNIALEPRLQKLRIFNPHLSDYDGILRIGGVPTHRIWRDLEENQHLLEVLSIVSEPFSGLSQGVFIELDLSTVSFKPKIFEFDEEFYPRQKLFQAKLQELFEKEPLAEPSLLHTLSSKIPLASRVYLGNSLPIREWDLTASIDNPPSCVLATRGLNGIDGALSCFFGLCDSQHHNVALIGDLTALYDFASFWAAQSLKASFTVIILNNGGGKIFSRMFPNKDLQNEHALSFEPFAQFWNLPYQKWESIPKNPTWGGIIEIIPDSKATNRFYDELDAIKKTYLFETVLAPC